MSVLVFMGFGVCLVMIALALCAALRIRGFTYADVQVPFFIIFLVALILFRWTLLTTNKEYTGDESIFLAETMKYSDDFLPWRSVDGNTSGPLDTWVIMWPSLLGLPATYCTARATGIILIFLTVLFSQKLMRYVLDPEWSLVLVLPLATMYCFLWDRGLAHYTSQDLPMALLAALAWVGFVSAKNPTPLRAFFIGLITGAAPLAKTQAGPIAAVITTVIFGTWILDGYRGALPRSKMYMALAIGIASIFLVPAAILVPVALGGAWNDFVIRYLWANLAYGARHASAFIQFTEILRTGVQITAYFIGMLICAFAAPVAMLFLPRPEKGARYPVEASIALAVICTVSWYIVIRSGFPSEGYLFFLVLPTLFVTSFFLRELESRLRLSERYASLRKLAFSLIVLISIFPQLAINVIWMIPIMEMQEYSFESDVQGSRIEPVVELLDKYRKPGDRLTLWGTVPGIYVYTGMIPGTRDVIGGEVLNINLDGFGMRRWDKSDYYKGVFIRELKEIKPRFFADVSRMYRRPEWGTPEQSDPATVPELAAILKNDYSVIGTFSDPAKGPVARVYMRNDK